VVAQRKGLADACGDFSASLHALSTVELSPSLSGPLDSLSDIQIRIRELYERQAQQDVLTMGIVIDEYIRLIGSVKTSFQQRQKAYHTWHTAESELQKRKTTQDKLLRQGRSQQDRLNQLSADVADAERRVHQARLLFEDMGRLMRSELERFEKEKVEDFKSGVETYLESAVEAQKEVSFAAYSCCDNLLTLISSSKSGRRSSCSLTLKKETPLSHQLALSLHLLPSNHLPYQPQTIKIQKLQIRVRRRRQLGKSRSD
jgi:hypothetical protein